MSVQYSTFEKHLDAASVEGRLKYKKSYPLSKASTFAIGGPAAYAVWPATAEELIKLTEYCQIRDIYYTVIGNGSNVLFADEGFDGAVIFTTAVNKTEITDNMITAGCGTPVTFLAAFAAKAGLSGLEFAYGIPGTVGGAIFMNAGAYGGEMKDVTVSTDWYNIETGERGTYNGDENRFIYRGSVYTGSKKIVLSAVFSLMPGDKTLIMEKLDDYMQRRHEKQPLEYPSAGSAFKRYPGYFTGQLIEEAGLKGFSVGGAQVSEKHAGFVINRGGATAGDVLALTEHIKSIIFEKNGINIEREIRIIPYRSE